mmetsp:Transcript_77608/g.153959  ORF Transcript_77608/g.153959 Transcript_77608/m.153959 type:complete len:266 (-) Transcript_77608:235-1032(-)
MASAEVPARALEVPCRRQHARLEQALKAEAGARCFSTDGESTVASIAGSPLVDMDDDEDACSYSFSDINLGAIDAHAADARSEREPADTPATSLAAAVAAQSEDEICHVTSRGCPSRHFLEALRRVGSMEIATVTTQPAAASMLISAPSAPPAILRRPWPTATRAQSLNVTSASDVSGSNSDPSKEQPTACVRADVEREAMQRPAPSPVAAADFLDPRIERSHFLQAVAVLRERAVRGALPPRRPPSSIAYGCCQSGSELSSARV